MKFKYGKIVLDGEIIGKTTFDVIVLSPSVGKVYVSEKDILEED